MDLSVLEGGVPQLFVVVFAAINRVLSKVFDEVLTRFCCHSSDHSSIFLYIQVSKSSAFPTVSLESHAVRIIDVEVLEVIAKGCQVILEIASSSGGWVVLSVVGPDALIKVIMWSVISLSDEFLFFNLLVFSCSTHICQKSSNMHILNFSVFYNKIIAVILTVWWYCY